MNGQGRCCGEILVVDDDDTFRLFVRDLLELGGHVVREASRGDDGVKDALARPPALAILDVNLPGLSGYAVCRALRDALGEDVAILFVSGDRSESYDRVAGFLVGCDDYLVKPFAPDELVARANALLRRGVRPPRPTALTPRELEILGLLAEGLARTRIADRLSISPKTVATHIEHILKKLGVHSRASAVALAYRHNLLPA